MLKYSISILIPVYNEERYILNCLESVVNSDYSKERMEVFVIDGNSEDKTKILVEEFQNKYSFINVLTNKDKIVPISMNIGIAHSKGDYIIRLDAHSYYPPNYFSELVINAVKYKTDNIGTVCLTDVKQKTARSLAIKTVLSSKFGVGNSLFRIGVNNPVEVDTVPFGCFTKKILNKVGGYDERLVRNQDIEINKRIKSIGGNILLLPEPKCIYYAREDYKSFAKNNFSNGEWNILTAYYTKKLNSLSLRHFVPLVFVSSILLPLLLSILDIRFAYFSIGILLLYLLVISFVSISLSKKISNYINLMCVFCILHFSYGIGSFVGIIKLFKLKFIGK